ncbi:axoneme-associated protein mst101(2)-like [Hippopotamus amphibius kiboko]|uniref:axoneme-associated protein mst101(2)-like n=1 Tax=Hippopotamus amphibius kiboko TaxID=575201 RepID=UPI002596BB90|nr:axoneme-associated protein mst101(2)-like [Hippopotamus amphibius kiboko]XP_057569678.1 axoneme-associated protein mst101(2)-like [Hippopotamus amphibius kiboko]
MQKEFPIKTVPALSKVAYRQDVMEYSTKYDKPESLKQYTRPEKIKEELEECCMNEEQAKREAAEREKELLEQKIKELLQTSEDQERAFEAFRVKVTEELTKRDNLLRKMNERIEMLEILRKIIEEKEEHYMKKCELLHGSEKTSADTAGGLAHSGVEEQAKREAAEREKDPREQKVKELQQKLDDQKRVLEGMRAKLTERMKEIEKTSAEEEWASGGAAERGEEPLEPKVKEVQPKMEDQERVFKGFTVKLTEDIREKNNHLRKNIERIEMLESIEVIKEELEECWMKTDELLYDAAKTSEECAEREPSEKEKALLEQKYKEICRKVEDQEKGFEEFMGKMIEKISKREKTSAEECARRVAAERENELLEQKVKELQEKLEDQERVSEGLRVKMTEEIREREKNSACTEELAKREVAKWEKKLLEQKIKELQQELKDQESPFEGFRVKITDKMREGDSLLRKMNKRIQMLESLLRIPEKLQECYIKKEEQAKREAAEREKEPLAQKVKELQQKLEDQERVFKVLRAKMTEELNERKKASAEEQAKREAAEREKESLEQKVKELQQNLEDQERVFEVSRAKMTEELNERKKASAEEQAKREATEREKESLEQKVKELQQNLEDQERVFEVSRAKMTEELNERKKASAEEQAKREAAEREKESLEQKVKEVQQNLEDQERAFEGLRTEMTEEIRESEKTPAEEQVKREAAEREKELFEQKVKELQEKLEDQERAFEAFRVKVTVELTERDNLLRKMNERIEMLEVTVNNDNDKDYEQNTENDYTS